MKLIQLEYFCETARCLSITRAAQKLYVTQPAVSSAVKELEKEFSVQLFTHVGNRLALTEEGKAFYEQGEQLLRQVEDTSRKLKDLGKQVPAVRIGIPPLLSTVLFPELLLQLKEECPKVRAELFEYGSARAAELVQKEELDLALVNMDFFEIDKFHSRCLWEDPFLFCTRSSHPLAGEKRLRQKCSVKNRFCCTIQILSRTGAFISGWKQQASGRKLCCIPVRLSPFGNLFWQGLEAAFFIVL